MLINTKAELRKHYLVKRGKLSEHQYENINNNILNIFKQINLDNVKFIHIFLPIAENREINTRLIINYLQSSHPNIKIVIPKACTVTHTMSSFVLDNDLVLEKNKWKILEPINGIPVSSLDIDMVIVPLLVVDKSGNRVGYGKGFYDRFLAECREDVITIGLSQFATIDDISDNNMHDVPIKYCICDDVLITF
jgi:5-formyltetrahydrofolate cyclo-ligase